MRRAASPLHDDAADQAPPGGAFPPDLHDTHHLRLKAFLLIVWVVFSFGACYFARDLQTLVPDWPLAYWLASCTNKAIGLPSIPSSCPTITGVSIIIILLVLPFLFCQIT